jgi:hypothetical protein
LKLIGETAKEARSTTVIQYLTIIHNWMRVVWIIQKNSTMGSHAMRWDRSRRVENPKAVGEEHSENLNKATERQKPSPECLSRSEVYPLVYDLRKSSHLSKLNDNQYDDINSRGVNFFEWILSGTAHSTFERFESGGQDRL